MALERRAIRAVNRLDPPLGRHRLAFRTISPIFGRSAPYTRYRSQGHYLSPSPSEGPKNGDWAAEDVFVVVSADYVGVGYSGEFEVTLSRWRDDSQTPYVVEPWIYITCKQSTDPQPYYWFWVAWSSPAGS